MNNDSNQDLCLPLSLRKISPLTIDVLRILDVCLIGYCQSHNADHKAEERTKQKKEEIHR